MGAIDNAGMCLFIFGFFIPVYLPYKLTIYAYNDGIRAWKRFKNNKKLKKRRDICPVKLEQLQIGHKYRFKYFDNTVSPYYVFEGQPNGVGDCLLRAPQGWVEHVDNETVFYKKRILGWSLVKCATKLLSLHQRAVVSANHPLRKLERGEFKEDE
jgi:hypothetical protein